ncbi:hypothetical protein ACW9ID_11640 [Pseudomonas gingeri]
MKLPLVLLGSGLIASISGCNIFTNYKELEANERLAIVTDVKRSKGNGQFEEFKVTCPEASPDALMMLAGSVSGESKAGVNLAAAYSESGSNIGLRTHSIQLLRDQLFSICQAYANQGLSNFTYQSLLARNQRNTIILMAIEQLTGVLKTPQVAITTNAQADTTSLRKITDELDAERTKLKAITDQSSQEAIDTKANIKALESALAAARTSTAKASGTVDIKPTTTQETVKPSEKDVITVSTTVKDLAQMVVDKGDADNLNVCMDLLRGDPNSGSNSISRANLNNNLNLSTTEYSSLRGTCLEMVKAMVESYSARLKVEAAQSSKATDLIKNAATQKDFEKIINSTPQLQ